MTFRIGVDVGGTFTDFCVLDDLTGDLYTLKVLSTPDKPGSEITQGIGELEKRFGIQPQDVAYFTHGTTVGVNTVIQRKGTRLALFVTRGFEDVLELARLKTPDMYDLFSKRPRPLIPRDRVFQIDERILADGTADRALSIASLSSALAAACAEGVGGIVVAFINAYRNSAHETEAAAWLRSQRPELPVFCSSEVWPVIREYERTVTTVINGYVQPRVSHYLGSFDAALKGVGIAAEAFVTKSNGGVMTLERGKSDGIQMILSGTASGVMGAAYFARLCGINKCFSLDIGGTSADVAFIDHGEPQFGTGELIGDFPIYIPSVSVASIGAGGGSIAWVDPLGYLKVGPESAGSQPGPACYGRGGCRVTVTDAFAACGLLGQSRLGYSAVQIDVTKAETAIAPIAETLGMTLPQTGEAIIRVAISGMFVDMSRMISRLGVDPRSATLLAFGGAGPMMGAQLAAELGIARVVVPIVPGVLSAMGGLIADFKNDFIKTVYADLCDALTTSLGEDLAALRETAVRWLTEETRYRGEFNVRVSLDMRYKGQSFELEVPVLDSWITGRDASAIAEAFHREHERLYEHCDRTATLQVINLRLVITGDTPKPALRRIAPAKEGIRRRETCTAWIEGKAREIPLYHRRDLLAGHMFESPAIVSQDDSTTYVPPGFGATVDEYGNLILER